MTKRKVRITIGTEVHSVQVIGRVTAIEGEKVTVDFYDLIACFNLDDLQTIRRDGQKVIGAKAGTGQCVKVFKPTIAQPINCQSLH